MRADDNHFKSLIKAAESGSDVAQAHLGWKYKQGEDLASPDYIKAIH